MDNNPNHQIIFSNDVEKSYASVMPKLSGASASSGRVNSMFVQAKGVYECFSETLSRDKNHEVFAVLSLVDVKGRHAQYCSLIALYNSLGFAGKSGHQPFSILSDKTAQLTKLDKFLLYLLYRPELESGQNIKQVESIFNKVYEPAKIEFLKQIKGD
ncbi:MAG: hypothetical protein DHS20C02_20330 [Micavibrio sp.]|nr:MAG: hypothetical protein DHS20C02_20330 [Micavibrio sp.]